MSVAVFALAVLSATQWAAPAHATAPPLRGTQTHAMWSSASQVDFDREFDALRDAGANTVRVDLGWSTLEFSGKGAMSSSYAAKMDQVIQDADARGIKVILTFWSTPCWASSAPDSLKQDCSGSWWDRDVQLYPPANPQHYADAAAWAAARWGPKLAAIELWNEPNSSYFLRSASPAADYAALVKAAYPRIKEAAPALPVLAGATEYSDDVFLRQLYAEGIAGYEDGISIHPYNGARDPYDVDLLNAPKYSFLTGIPAVRDVMVQNGDEAVGLWLTEFGWSSCAPGGPTWACVTTDQQAQYTPRALDIIRNRWDFVSAAILYELRNANTDPTSRIGQYGLLNRDFTPKPAYASFADALLRLEDPIQVDTVAPETAIDSAPPAPTSSASAKFAFSSSESGSRFECRLDGGAWSQCSSAVSYSSVALGAHLFEVRAIDSSENVDTTPAAAIWAVVGPSLALTAPTSGALFSKRLCVHTKASADIGISKVEFAVDGKVVGSDTSGPGYDLIWSVPNKTTYAGHTVTAKAYDAAGHTASTSVSVRRTQSAPNCS